jgi:outer membrane protein assembly factor BamB/Flp pilus assembly protein TadD
LKDLIQRAWQLVGQREPAAARAAFLRWTELEPSSAAAWFGAGWCEAQLAGPADSEPRGIDWESKMLRALALDESSQALSPAQRGFAHMLLGSFYRPRDVPAAAHHYRKAVEQDLDPELAVLARNELAVILARDGDLETAERLLNDALIMDPGDPRTAQNLAAVRRARASFDIVFESHVPMTGRTVVRVHPDDTLAEIATRVLGQNDIPVVGGWFFYSGDAAVPAWLDMGNREPHETVRKVGIQPRDTLLYMNAGEVSRRDSAHQLIRDVAKYRQGGLEDLAQQELRSAMGSIDDDIADHRLDQARLLAETILRLQPGELRATQQLAQIKRDIARRDAGSDAAKEAEWCQAHGGSTRTAQAIRAPAPPLHDAWEFRAGPEVTAPVIAEGRIFVGSWDGNVYCLDALSGEQRWRWRASGPVREPPAIAGVNLIVLDRDAVSCLDARTGELRWHSRVLRPACAVICEHEIIVGTGDGVVRTIESSSGKAIGDIETGAPDLRGLAARGTRVFATGSRSVLALDRRTSRVIWRREGRFHTVPVCAYDRVYVGSFAEGLWCLDEDSGRRLGIFCTDAPINAAPAAGRGRVVFGDTGGGFGCLDATTGELLWDPKDWIANRTSCSAAPVIAGLHVYVRLDDGVLRCLDLLGGNELWQATAQASTQGIDSLAVTANAVYFATTGGYLGCLGAPELAARMTPTAPAPPPSRSSVPEPPEDIDIVFEEFPEPSALSSEEAGELMHATHSLVIGSVDEALAILRRLAEAHPREQRVLHNLAHAYLRTGHIGDALTILDRILEIDPGNRKAFSMLAWLLRIHRDIIKDIFGDPTGESSILPAPPPPPEALLTIALHGEAPVVLWRSAHALSANLAAGPAWYWWQLLSTATYPVLRLHLEIDHQPNRWVDLALPVDIADGNSADWLSRLLTRDVIVWHVYDPSGQPAASKVMTFGADHKSRLRDLTERARQQLEAIAADQRDFHAAIAACKE